MEIHEPKGYSIIRCEHEEFFKNVDDKFESIYDQNELILRPPTILSENEKAKLKSLNENFRLNFALYQLVYFNNEVVGWSWGFQDTRESFYMVNSAILPNHRRQGLYKILLDQTVKILSEAGFQKIWSRHSMTNNSIIIPKLKKGFYITGTELNDTFGALVQLTYYVNKTREKVLDFRVGHLRPDDELKKLFKL